LVQKSPGSSPGGTTEKALRSFDFKAFYFSMFTEFTK